MGKHETLCVQCACTIRTRLSGYRSLCSVECEVAWASTHVLNGKSVYGDPKSFWVSAGDRSDGLVLRARRCWSPDTTGRFVPEDHLAGPEPVCEKSIGDIRCASKATLCDNGVHMCTWHYVRTGAPRSARVARDDETAACTAYYTNVAGDEFALDFRDLHVSSGLTQPRPLILQGPISPAVLEAITDDYEDWQIGLTRPEVGEGIAT